MEKKKKEDEELVLDSQLLQLKECDMLLLLRQNLRWRSACPSASYYIQMLDSILGSINVVSPVCEPDPHNIRIETKLLRERHNNCCFGLRTLVVRPGGCKYKTWDHFGTMRDFNDTTKYQKSQTNTVRNKYVSYIVSKSIS